MRERLGLDSRGGHLFVNLFSSELTFLWMAWDYLELVMAFARGKVHDWFWLMFLCTSRHKGWSNPVKTAWLDDSCLTCQKLKLEYPGLLDLASYKCVTVINRDCDLSLDGYDHAPIQIWLLYDSAGAAPSQCLLQDQIRGFKKSACQAFDHHSLFL